MCGIIGFKHVGDPTNLRLSKKFIEALLRWSKVRGLHATGIAWTNPNQKSIQVLKRSLPADEFMKLKEWVDLWEEEPKSGILHTRYSTSGDYHIPQNNQPLAIGQLAIVHNGLVSMATKSEFEKQYAVKTSTENDSEIILRKIIQHLKQGKEIGTAIQSGLDEIHKVHPPIFACGLLDVHGELYCFKDHVRPLYLWDIPALNLHGFCSTKDIFMRACMDCNLNTVNKTHVNGEAVRVTNDANVFSTVSYRVYLTDPKARCFHAHNLTFSYPNDHKFTRPDGLLSGVDKNLLQNDILTTDSALDYPPNPKRDFRSLADRREGFIQWYVGELLSDMDPAFPTLIEIFDRYELSLEQRLWVSFLYAHFYENASVFLVSQEFPELEKIDMGRMQRWHDKNWQHLQYQTDRRWFKGHLVEQTASYKQLIGDQTQFKFFQNLMVEDPKQSFRNVWAGLLKVKGMGRHSVYAWVETLIRCVGLPLECDSFFMAEAESSRNGLCYALGRDDLLTKHDKKLATGEAISSLEIKWLEQELETLMHEMKGRFPNLPVDYMYMETACCSIKGGFRGKRYVGYYLDRMAKEIHRGEETMAVISQGIDWSTLWQIRSEIFMWEFLGERQTNKPWLDIRKELLPLLKEKGYIVNLGPLKKRGLLDTPCCL